MAKRTYLNIKDFTEKEVKLLNFAVDKGKARKIAGGVIETLSVNEWKKIPLERDEEFKVFLKKFRYINVAEDVKRSPEFIASLKKYVNVPRLGTSREFKFSLRVWLELLMRDKIKEWVAILIVTHILSRRFKYEYSVKALRFIKDPVLGLNKEWVNRLTKFIKENTIKEMK